MKKILVLAAISASSVALADWGDATGGPSYPQVCIHNRTGYNVQVYVDQQPRYVSPYQIQRVSSYQHQQMLFSMNTRQLEPYGRAAWIQQYVTPSRYGCDNRNTVTIYQYRNILGVQ